MREQAAWAMPVGSGERWAEDYERGRPGWPAAVAQVAGTRGDATVLDLAAGTGKLTRLLIEAFAHVIAVEPAEPMRRLLARNAPGAEVLEGAAEAIPLTDGSVEAVFVAEAFHRFDDDRALAEIARILRPGGALVLLWNLPAGPWTPAIDAAEEWLLARGPSPDEVSYDPLDLDGPQYTEGRWRRHFGQSLFGPLHEERLPNPHTLDRDGLVAFFASMGWLADLPDRERLPLLDELRARLPVAQYRREWETRANWTKPAGRSPGLSTV